MEKRSYTISTVAKYRTRLLRLRGNFVKVLGYCFHFFFPKKRFSLPCVERSSLNTEHSMKIPRKIWQTNFSEKCTLPMYWNFKHNRSMSPEFEYNYVSTEARDDYMRTHGSERVYAAYRRLTDGAAQADLWRLLVLYNEGGVYIDIDATIVKPLRECLRSTNDYVFVMNYGEYSNFFIATVAKSPLFQELLEEVVGNIENYDANEGKSVFDVTGPGALEKVLNRRNIPFEPHQNICVQGAYTNEHFQYMDRPRTKWIYKKTFIN